jgi:hypothetical protein
MTNKMLGVVQHHLCGLATLFKFLCLGKTSIHFMHIWNRSLRASSKMKKQTATLGYSSSALGRTLKIHLGRRFKFKSEHAFNKFKIQTIVHPYRMYAHSDSDQWMGVWAHMILMEWEHVWAYSVCERYPHGTSSRSPNDWAPAWCLVSVESVVGSKL